MLRGNFRLSSRAEEECGSSYNTESLLTTRRSKPCTSEASYTETFLSESSISGHVITWLFDKSVLKCSQRTEMEFYNFVTVHGGFASVRMTLIYVPSRLLNPWLLCNLLCIHKMHKCSCQKSSVLSRCGGRTFQSPGHWY